MWLSAECMFLYLETALHVGSGVPGETIDLPIQREPLTGYPVVPSSSLKGCLRAYAGQRRNAKEVVKAFGSSPEDPEKSEGLLVFSNAYPLLYPVRSLKGLFAWITSPEVLARWQREISRYGLDLELPAIPELADDTAGVTAESLVLTAQQGVVLEELSFTGRVLEQVTALGTWLAATAFPADPAYDYWRQRVQQAVVVLPEEVFRYFVEQTTPVLPRIKIDDVTGMAAEGALWNEEYLPPETLLYALVGVQELKVKQPRLRPAPAKALAWLKELGLEQLQLGGRRTLGCGLVQVQWSGGKEQS